MDLNIPLAQLEGAQLIHASPEMLSAYSFKHALVQDTVYASLLKQQRKHLHRVTAATIELLYPEQESENAARLADHYWLAEEWERAAEYSRLAGMDALRVYALREALGNFERALSALEQVAAPPPPQIYDVLMGWAEAAAKFRPYAEQLQNLARAESIARALDDKPRLARVLYSIGGVHTAQGHNLRAGAPLAECFTLAHELDDESLTIIPTYFMGMATLDANPRAAIALFERAIELARRYENQDIEAVAWTTKAWALGKLGEFAAARAAVEQGQALLDRVRSPMTASDVDLFTGWSFLEMGDAEQGLLYGQRGADKALAAENMDCVCGAYLCVGFNQLLGQNLAQAQAAFQEAIRESRFSGAEGFENLGRAGLSVAQFYAGRNDAVSVLEQTYAGAQALNDPSSRALIARQLGEIYALRGETARAGVFLTDAVAFFRHTEMAPSLASTLELLARVYEQEGRTVDAATARAEASQWRDRLGEEWSELPGENSSH